MENPQQTCKKGVRQELDQFSPSAFTTIACLNFPVTTLLKGSLLSQLPANSHAQDIPLRHMRKRITQDTQNGVPQVNFSFVCPESKAPSLLFIQFYSYLLIFFPLLWKIESKLSSDGVSSHAQCSATGLALRTHSPGSTSLIWLMR